MFGSSNISGGHRNTTHMINDNLACAHYLFNLFLILGKLG